MWGATVSLAFQLTGSKLAPNVTDPWKLGADLTSSAAQSFIHEYINQFSKVPIYRVVNLHSSYQVTKNVEVFGHIQNLFNTHYYSTGIFFQTGGFTIVGGGIKLFANLSDLGTFLAGMPLALYAGIKATFETCLARATLANHPSTKRDRFVRRRYWSVLTVAELEIASGPFWSLRIPCPAVRFCAQ